MNRIGAQLVGARSLRCDGHTDNVGSAAYNRALGLARAKAVCRVLGRYVPHVTSKSFGESKPVASNKTTSGRARNRRVEIQIFN
jgi:outer membrane protein OmpA-like peptidoglycan-associated protein